MKYLFAWLCLLISIPAVSNTVETFHVGDSNVDGNVLKPYKNRWKMIHVTKDGTREEQGVWTDEGTVTIENGQQIFRRLQDEISPGSHFITMNLMDLKTLAPIISERKQELGEDAFDIKDEFHGSRVTSTCTGRPCHAKLNFGDGQTTRTIELVEPVFDYLGGVWGMLFPAFPLKENSDIRFASFSETKGLVWIDVHVRGLESVAAGSGKTIQAWAVEWPKMNWVFWISKEPPYVIRLVTPEQDGGSMNYEMF